MNLTHNVIRSGGEGIAERFGVRGTCPEGHIRVMWAPHLDSTYYPDIQAMLDWGVAPIEGADWEDYSQDKVTLRGVARMRKKLPEGYFGKDGFAKGMIERAMRSIGIPEWELRAEQVAQAPSDSSEPNREWKLFIGELQVGWLECFPMVCGMACGWSLYTQEGHGIDKRDVGQTWQLQNTSTTRIPYGIVQETLLFIIERAFTCQEEKDYVFSS